MTSPTPQAVSGISFELLGLLLFVHKVKFRDALLPVTTHYIRYVILCCVAHSDKNSRCGGHITWFESRQEQAIFFTPDRLDPSWPSLQFSG